MAVSQVSTPRPSPQPAEAEALHRLLLVPARRHGQARVHVTGGTDRRDDPAHRGPGCTVLTLTTCTEALLFTGGCGILVVTTMDKK